MKKGRGRGLASVVQTNSELNASQQAATQTMLQPGKARTYWMGLGNGAMQHFQRSAFCIKSNVTLFLAHQGGEAGSMAFYGKFQREIQRCEKNRPGGNGNFRCIHVMPG